MLLMKSMDHLAHFFVLHCLHVTAQALMLLCQLLQGSSMKLSHCQTSETAKQFALISLSGYIQTDISATQRNKCKTDSINITTFLIILGN